MFRMAGEQTLVGILFAGIERLPSELRPPKDTIFRWYAASEKIRLLNERLNQRASEITAHFRQEGFRSCILKGQGLAQLYPNPQLRTPGDIDLWLDGSRQNVLRHCRKRFPSAEVRYHHMHFPIFKDAEVEIHFTPSWMNNPADNCRLQRFFKSESHRQMSHAIRLRPTDGTIAVPTADFNRIYILLHIYRHLLGEGIGLRQLMDYYYVLSQGFTEDERQATLHRLRQLHMLRFAAAVMHVMKEVFGMEDKFLLLPPDAKAGAQLIDEVMRAGNFGKYDQRIDRRKHASAFHRFKSSIRRNAHFLRHYPLEVLWDPPFKLWLFGWRYLKGYV